MNYKPLLLIFVLASPLSNCSNINTNSVDDSSNETIDSSSVDEGYSDTSSTEDVSSEEIEINDSWTNDDYGNYYSSIDFTSPSTMLKQLQTLNAKKRTSTVGYSGLKTKFTVTDYDPNNKRNILSFYSGKSMSSTWDGGTTWNREHVWPNSRGGGLVEDDIHVIRPTLSNDNSNRGNSFYVANMATSSSGWDPKEAGLDETYRGQAARIIFYCAIANSSLSIVDKSTDDKTNKTMGKLSDLLKWNLQYEVAQSELNRNNGAQSLQGNRNPFIDRPSLACAIWGNTNDSTKQICSSYYVPEKNPDNNNQEEIVTPPVDKTSNWTLVTSTSQLNEGDQIVLAYNASNVVAGGELASTYLNSVSSTFSNDKTYITSLSSSALIFTLGKQNNDYTFQYNGKFLAAYGDKKVGFDEKECTWSITIDNGVALIDNSSSLYGLLQYNISAPRFTIYNSASQKNLNIYKYSN